MAIGLRVSRGGVDIFYPKLLVDLLKRLTYELWPVFQDYDMWDPEPAYDVPLHKLSQVTCLNLRIGLGLHPLSKIIYSNK